MEREGLLRSESTLLLCAGIQIESNRQADSFNTFNEGEMITLLIGSATE